MRGALTLMTAIYVVFVAGATPAPAAADPPTVLSSALSAQPPARPAAFDPDTAPAIEVASVFSGSASVPCAAGTTDLGVHDGYHSGIKIPIRLCAVPDLPSTATESNRSSGYYVKSATAGANGHAIVNSRISGAALAMVREMKAAGLSPSTFSSYRSMERQQSLCAKDSGCPHGDYHMQAKPGTSNHQMGLAIDFDFHAALKSPPGSTCATPASAPTNAVWKWLTAHATRYGFQQYAAEAWHWEAASANRC
ncbi:MAG TPA: M15 family metallopeptidase [Pseudonocardia sp.]|jgi:hypothetical protein